MTSGLVDRHPLKEKRRANKPLLERKRRARINDSLTDLKHLVLSSLNKDVSKYNKMEKVDILDMTVRFLKGRCLEQEDCSSMYRAGYQECTKTMYQNIMTMDGLDHSIKCRILSNLANSQREDSTKMSPPPSPTNQYPVSPNNTNLNSRLFAPPPPQFQRQHLPPLVRKTPVAPAAPLRCLPPILERTSPKEFDRRSPPKSPLWRPW